MRYVVEITAQAEADLRGIFEYIAFALQSLQNAAGQLSRLEQSIYALDEMPERFPRYKAEPWFSRGLRVMSVDNYCVFCLPGHEEGIVRIIRVIYGGRDLQAELAKHTVR